MALRSLLVILLNPNVVATHRFNADEGDWGFTRFCELRRLFNMPWEGRGVPLVQNDEAKVTAYVRVVKDPTGVLWHSFQKYVLVEYVSVVQGLLDIVTTRRRRLAWWG
jgi:hypothetical protein